MALVETTSNSNQLVFPGSRRIEMQTSTLNLFYLTWFADHYRIHRSIDRGATWPIYGGSRPAEGVIADMGSLFIDWQNRLYFSYRVTQGSFDRIYMQAGIITPTGISWHSPLLVASASHGGVPGNMYSGTSIVAVRHPDGRSTGMVAAGTRFASQTGLTLHGFTIPAVGQPILNNSVIFRRPGLLLSANGTPYISGDGGRSTPAMGYELQDSRGRTPASLAPAHVWVTFGRTWMYAAKLTWNGAGWNAPTTTIKMTPGNIFGTGDVVSTPPPHMDSCASVWRNPGWMVAQPHPEDPTTVLLSERNQANSATTYKVSETHPTGAIEAIALSLNTVTRDVRVYARTSFDIVYHCDYVSATGLCTSWVLTAGSTPITGGDNFTVRRDNVFSAQFDVLTLTGAGPTWSVNHTAQKAVYAPFVPTWNEGVMGRPNGSAADVSSTLLLQWVFSDADPGDTQSAWALRRYIGEASPQYFRASDSTWQVAEQKNIGTTNNRTLAAAWGVDGAEPHTYQVRVWDASDTASGYSDGYVLLPSTKVNPTITLSEIVDLNRTLDTGFEAAGTTGYVGIGGTLSQSSTFAHTGTKSAKLVSAAASYPKARRDANDGVVVGQQYTLDAWLYAPVALPNQAYVSLEWWNGTSKVSESATFITMPVGVWTHVAATGVAPGGVTGCRRLFGLVGDAPAGLELYGDDLFVLSPWSGVIHTDRVIASWAVTEMSGYRVTLSTNPGGVVVYDSGWRKSRADTTMSHEIPYRLPQGTSWTVGLQTLNNDGLASNLVTAGFSVDYAEPPTPELTPTPLPDQGIIRLAIENPAPIGAQPDLVEQTVYRRPRTQGNLLPMPGLESDTGTGWTARGGSGARSTTEAHSGDYSFFMTPDGLDPFPRADGPLVALTGEMYAGGWIRAEGGPSQQLQICIHAYDASGAYLESRGHRFITAAIGQWVFLDTVTSFGDLPTAALCTVALGRSGASAAATFYVDDAWLAPYVYDDGIIIAQGRLTDVTSNDVVVADTYTRTVASGWGTPDTGAAWTVSGGPSTDFSVDGAFGKMLLGSVATGRRAVTPGVTDVDVVASVVVPFIPTGTGGINVGILARYTDTNNFYLGEAMILPDLTVLARIRKSVAGSFTTVLTSSAIPALTHTIGTTYRQRFVVQGTSLRLRIWDASITEPSVWHLDVVDTSLNPSSSDIGYRSATDTGNTNSAPFPTVYYDALLVTGLSGGGSSATTVDDWHPTSGIDYEYRVLSQATNGTSIAGAWTA